MKISKNSLLLLVLAFVLSLVLAACASEPDDSGSDDGGDGETAEDGEVEGGEGQEGGDLEIARLSDVTGLDPAGSNDVPSSDVQENIFETLVKQDMDMELQPGLAESWEAVEDDVWEFNLREDVTFHDGSEFNADVVKANIERIMDEDVASPRAFLYEMVTDIEVVDDYTVRFTTEYPFAPLPAHLAHTGGSMVGLDQIEEDYAAMEDGEEPGSVINENPIGTGYFEFDEWSPGELVRLTKNEDYWDDPALLDSVTFKVVDEDLTRVAEVTTGDSHIGDPLSPSDVEQIETTDGVHVHDQASVSLSYIGFNMQKEPFDDERVRQAISMAIDKDQIIDGIYDGVGIPAIGPIPPDVFGYDENVSGLDYDVEQAKELLAEAGYEDGFSTTIWTNDNRERIDAATNVQAQLEEIGIDAEVEVMEFGAYLEQTANGEQDMFVLGWSVATGDADYALHPLFHSDNLGEPGNRTFTENDELDALLEEGRQEGDPEAREEIYSEAQELLVDIAPMSYIHHQEYLYSIRDEVKGFEVLPTQIMQLKDVYIEE
ncbi:glutathione ABC transporter substrate-binding protein [Virgibacillus sp. NKC19-3]|uniref:glutathione ABC transporter substrate-binding protein n=1 Tax=Virgibacillus saliphilus TaxID=2831674 RepID=UPI001C9A9C90|nr:glutathione ABC transporter substrate-binding protein [Virgibacillus sp. NKC19-3]MBY7144872.1 glutathione ABC transporter substrate-binding protein [Virgibacillus sp. NKC19-3]